MGQADPSLISFVNTTENAWEMAQVPEVVFNNKSLFKHIDCNAKDDLQKFISTPVFAQKDMK
jgi:hypothetical protein